MYRLKRLFAAIILAATALILCSSCGSVPCNIATGQIVYLKAHVIYNDDQTSHFAYYDLIYLDNENNPVQVHNFEGKVITSDSNVFDYCTSHPNDLSEQTLRISADAQINGIGSGRTNKAER